MMVIRALQRYGVQHDNPLPEEEEQAVPPDTKDALFIDECISRLRRRSPDFERLFPVLKAEYLTKYSVEDYEEVKDIAEARRIRARYARVFDRDYDPILLKVESLLCEYVTRCEKILSSPL